MNELCYATLHNDTIHLIDVVFVTRTKKNNPFQMATIQIAPLHTVLYNFFLTTTINYLRTSFKFAHNVVYLEREANRPDKQHTETKKRISKI